MRFASLSSFIFLEEILLHLGARGEVGLDLVADRQLGVFRGELQDRPMEENNSFAAPA